MKKVLIVGAGRIAGLNEFDNYRLKPCTHIGAFNNHKDFNVEGICDIDLNKANDFASKFKLNYSFDNISLALKKIRPDLVTIAVPYKFNYEIIQKISNDINKPKIIFCEKPIASNIDEAKKIVEICKYHKILLFINNRRLSSSFKLFSKIYKDEFNSEGIFFNTWCSSGLNAIGIHMIDLLRAIFGEVEWVNSFAEKKRVEKLDYSTNFHKNDPRVSSQIYFKNGITGNFMNTALINYTYFEIEVLCKSGKIRISDNGDKIEIFKLSNPTTSTLSYKLNNPETVNYSETESLFSLISKSIHQAKSDNKNHPLSGEHGLRSYIVLDAMVKSSKIGKTIYINK